ncbi:MAG TPA: NUDIX domain-containing protein [Actinomycetes bacterium]|nr:NUDIX domain-containing protein [Actinomycetes bacterium]
MSEPPIVAAGCLVTRRAAAGLEVLVVHRPRYDDWSLPKGKAHDNEHLTLTAVREVLEETGVVVSLRRPLPQRRYEVDGVPKVVHYWRAVVESDQGFQPSEEVDELRWLAVDQAAALVTHPDDAAIVKLAGDPAGTPFIVLRHGTAVKRAEWSGDDVDRPLDEHGVAQSSALITRLAAYGVRRVHTSAARRCTDTVRPYALTVGVPLVAEPTFTEENFRNDPAPAFERLGELVAEAWRSDDPAVLCGHRPFLPQLVDRVVELCPAVPVADPWELPLPDTVPTASMTVLHVHQDEHDGRPSTLAVEHHTR